MLMHSCYCIFISVTGGFVQRLKDFKNLLKMSLKILFIKRKRENSFHSSPSSHSAPWPFLSPRPSTTASAPAHPFPARPSFAPAAQPRAPRRPSRAQPSTVACARTRQPPAQHRAPASRAQPLTARPRPSARPPPLPRARAARKPSLQQPPPLLASWEPPPRASASF